MVSGTGPRVDAEKQYENGRIQRFKVPSYSDHSQLAFTHEPMDEHEFVGRRWSMRKSEQIEPLKKR